MDSHIHNHFKLRNSVHELEILRQFRIRKIIGAYATYALLFISTLLIFYKSFSFISGINIIKHNPPSVDFKVTAEIKDPAQKGYLLLSPRIPNDLQDGKLVIIDLSGNIILEKPINGIASDFRQWKIDGHTWYSYLVYDRNACQVMAALGSSRHAVILDSALREIRQIHLMPFNDITTSKKQDLDHHDFILLSLDHYITIASYPKIVHNIPRTLSGAAYSNVAVPVIQEVKNGAVVWQWDASDYPEFYNTSVRGNDFSNTAKVQDYMHINSIFLDPRDGNLIVSFHNLDQVVKINRPTGDIIWRLGGKNSDFPMTADTKFYNQHNATLTDNNQTLLILDNGEKNKRPYSRVLEFKLNENSKYITSFKSYDIPGKFIENQGSVQKIGGDYFICGGDANYFLRNNAATGAKKIKMDYNCSSYRSYYVDDITGIKVNNKTN